MNTNWKRVGTIAAVIWLSAIAIMVILQVVVGDELFQPKWELFWQLFSLINAVALITAILCYIKSKGRSAWWLLLVGLLPVIGLIAVLLMEDRSNKGPSAPEPS